MIECVCIILAAHFLKMPESPGSSESDIAEDTTNGLSAEIDHISSLLQQYLVNETAAEANVPLSEDELLRVFKLLSMPTISDLTLTKPSHWLPSGPTHSRLFYSARNIERIIPKLS
jgi:hypothetical protein